MEPFTEEKILDENVNTRTYRFTQIDGNLKAAPHPTAVVSSGQLTVTRPGNQGCIKDASIASVANVDIQKEHIDVTVNKAK